MLLKNQNTLPFPTNGGPKSIAVVGPFAACMSSDPQVCLLFPEPVCIAVCNCDRWAGQPADLSCRGRGGCESQCYLHSYNGFPTNTTSFYGGILASAKAAGKPNSDYALSTTYYCKRVCDLESDAAVDRFSVVAGASVTYAVGANLTCPQVTRSGGAVADFTCLDPHNASGFYSPAAADAITAAVAAAKSADVTVLAVGLGAIMEAEGNDRCACIAHLSQFSAPCGVESLQSLQTHAVAGSISLFPPISVSC